MRAHSIRLVMLTSVISSTVLAMALAPTAAAGQPVTAAVAAGPLWAATYAGPNDKGATAASVAVDAVTGAVYVAGSGDGDYATVAYTASGGQLWIAGYDGTGGQLDAATAVAVDPGRGVIYVTGYSTGTAGTGVDYATVAYDRAGQQLWVSRYDYRKNGESGDDRPVALVVDQGSGNVHVTGSSAGFRFSTDYVTVTYDAGGQLLWTNAYDDSGEVDFATGIVLDPDSGGYIVSGYSYAAGAAPSDSDYATIGYTATGARRWVTRTNGPPSPQGNPADVSRAVALDPRRGVVYVTGFTWGASFAPAELRYQTVAYRVVDGAQLWTAQYAGPGGGGAVAEDVEVDPGTGLVVVGGSSADREYGGDYTTVAYRPNGIRAWVAGYSLSATSDDNLQAVAIDPLSHRVYVTGTSKFARPDWAYDIVTVGYTVRGRQLRVERYNGAGDSFDSATAAALDPGSGNLFVSGESSPARRPLNPVAMLTVAYRTR